MNDELELLKDLPRHRPPADLRPRVRIAALAKLSEAPRPWWRLTFEQLAIQLSLAAASVVYLLWAAEHTPLLR
jgi:hypothetical protein